MLQHVQPVEQVVAEAALLHLLAQRPVGGRHHAHVHLDGLRGRPRRIELAVLEHAQQLHLRGRRDVADLVQEQRAAVGQLEPPQPRARRPR